MIIHIIEGELEVFQVLERSDEVENLSVGPFGFSQAERSERRQEVSEALTDLRHEHRDIQMSYLQFLDVFQCAKQI